MGPLFGMAGLAEAAFTETAGLLCFGVVWAFAAAFLALVLRSRIAAVVGLLGWALLAIWLVPWQDLRPEPTDDPDLRSFQDTFRRLAWWWIAASISLTVTTVRAFRPRHRTAASATRPPT